MNQKALKILEYDKIILQLRQLAQSEPGKKMVDTLKPYSDLETIIRKQNETSEALSTVLKYGSLPIRGTHLIGPSLKRLAIGGNLSILELLHIGDVLRVASRLKSYFREGEEMITTLSIAPLFLDIEPLTPLLREIDRCIISEDTIADEASSQLHQIRRSIQNTHAKIRSNLNSIINNNNQKTMLQDPIITIRNDRFCVPVKAEYRSQFKGMIHDQSSTGSTLFIEPMSVVELNNGLTELAHEEQEEINRILAELSALAAMHMDALKINLEVMAELDFIFAKAELALKQNATLPKFNDNKEINLKKARHPLLSDKEVVPIDIYLGKSFNTLVITGPNTGGKTVTLKTLGLFSLMGQAGLHIPAFDGSSLTVFDEIYADIGDEQSIEQSLSTFSSHMVNIVDILKKATIDSLVLFDELGAGTDPTEGAALAMATLENLFARRVLTVATTHYSELKVYALSTEGVENASCEFDVTTLRPTYRLLIGVPGKSNAFAISKRLGLGDDIIEEAKALLQQKEVRFEDLITDLEINKKAAIAEKEKAEKYRKETEILKRRFDLQKEAFEQKKQEMLTEAKKEAYKITEAAKEEADRLIRHINRIADSAQIDTKALEESRSTLRQSMSKLENDMGLPKAKSKGTKAKDIAVGDTVFVAPFNGNGTVLSLPNNKGEIQVQMGIMKSNVSLKDVTVLQEDSRNTKEIGKKASTKGVANKAYSISTEIDLRGEMTVDALQALDKYLDDAYLSKLPMITIIHGKGTGALRTAIHKHLKKVKYVDSFRIGAYGEGESGVTIVEFK
ncbi:MAG: endonuclease MutS2 [Firmicutes bacterium HGW-Firmicutes-2]|jgi:DNA mismatch repair protein MutS2|nr:MAG: endonuclease MutS2 [Firmicutes bacterium HGW-Firmicutes-2]